MADFDHAGSIRGDYCLAVGRNVCHGSDSVESAEKEIALLVFVLLHVLIPYLIIVSWFPEGVVQYTSAMERWVFE